MNTTLILFLSLACIAAALARRTKDLGSGSIKEFSGRQKLIGLIAVILACLILLSPEFAALGLLGDASFFDLLVLALSAQLLGYAQWVWRGFSGVAVGVIRRFMVLSPVERYMVTILVVASGIAFTWVQKVVQRVMS